MVKKTKNQNNKRKTRTKSRPLSRPAAFGPVSQINTAPVSVGNSVRGSRPRVTQTTNGARVVGRDFAFALSATAAAVTGWEIIGGMPITPCCLPSSVLRNYCQMFQKFKVNSITVHYITSSPTSQAGDVLFYYERDALAPMCDYSNSSFLPFVLSDPHTMIGPQWTNHSALIKPTADWKTTLFGNQSDINEDKAGSLFFFSKTNAANSPGYLLIDYDISFKELSVNPRAGTLPIARAQSHFACITATSFTAGSAATWSLTSGDTTANVVSTVPNGYALGDIYKVVFQVTASQLTNPTWTGTTAPTVSNMLQYTDNKTITIDDGFTCYGRANATTTIALYSTLEAAVTNAGEIEAQTSFGGTQRVDICVEMQLVRNIDDLTQASY
jgi:hypothetical protein